MAAFAGQAHYAAKAKDSHQRDPQPGRASKSQAATAAIGRTCGRHRRIKRGMKRRRLTASVGGSGPGKSHSFGIFRRSFTEPITARTAKPHLLRHGRAALGAKLVA